MRENLLSIRWRNAYGNVGLGICLLVLGAALAAKAGLTLLGLEAVFGMLLETQIDLSALSCVFIGVILVGYGLAFAWLERC